MNKQSAIQTAIYEALTGNSTLTSAVNGIFDDTGQDYGSFPYVTIGEISSTDFSTDDKLGSINNVAIHTWSRADGKREAQIVNGYIYDILNRSDLTVPGYTWVDCLADSANVMRDPDGETYHGIITFNITLLEV